MATILLPYQFNETSFKAACQMLRFFEGQDATFLLTHVLPPQNNGQVLISIEDLVRQEIERKLLLAKERLEGCCQVIPKIKALVITERELLSGNLPESIDYLVRYLEGALASPQEALEKISYAYRKLSPEVAMLFFRMPLNEESPAKILWIEERKSEQESLKKFDFASFTQALTLGFQALKSASFKKVSPQVDFFHHLPKYVTQQQPDVIVIH